MVDVQNSGQDLPSHWNVLCFPHDDGLRQPVFTGPDGLAPCRAHRLVDHRPVGTNPYTTEATYDTDYLWRAPPRRPGTGTPIHLRPRSSLAGEIGWHYYALHRHPDPAWTGHQILTSEFRREVEDVFTHRFQNPWYPGEGEVGDPVREGAYFEKFPHTGHRARTSHDFRSKSSSSHSSGNTTSSPFRRRPWRRTPAATTVTIYNDNGDIVSMEHSEEGGTGVSNEDEVSHVTGGHNNNQHNNQYQHPRSTGFPGSSQRRIAFRDD